MKKILAFLLAVSMILAMAACAAAPAQTTTEPAKTEETPATENTATECWEKKYFPSGIMQMFWKKGLRRQKSVRFRREQTV